MFVPAINERSPMLWLPETGESPHYRPRTSFRSGVALCALLLSVAIGSQLASGAVVFGPCFPAGSGSVAMDLADGGMSPVVPGGRDTRESSYGHLASPVSTGGLSGSGATGVSGSGSGPIAWLGGCELDVNLPILLYALRDCAEVWPSVPPGGFFRPPEL